MTTQPSPRRQAGPRDLLYFATPALWPCWPFLPLVRPRPGVALLDSECGVLCDLAGLGGTGHRFTVFLGLLPLLPRSVEGMLALPREEYHCAEQVAAAGWVVD
jgi:hypothetical protein